ncbi:peptidoglycan-associated lipoprotein [Sphingomonas jejuensis]|uniref:Peptidoglycan-associated lipoprotein n=1 Tax=Sphingomonas jejuensis TaxID=904715 RepID=A0ABX0XP01_9SPHN|nr:peptidoglycan-associated lipoprotein Pal [Sphingomonas jejuensis]NJC34509.1 peptidoglycan-associated lipoprotein [Sphingomonas jejuensis]
MNKAIMMVSALSLVTVAGCARRAPEQLPPPPATTAPETGYDTGAGTGQTGTTVVPGSQADFLQSVNADRVLFATDSSDIDSQARSILDSQAQWLARYPNVRITIEGHADERGTREYNLALGDRRATAASNYLQAQGVSASRINVISYGKERPEATGSDEGAWAQNRRAVTVTVGN